MAKSLAAKIAEARGAGYSDDEITAYIAKDPTYAPKIEASQKAGYAATDIVKHLSRPVGVGEDVGKSAVAGVAQGTVGSTLGMKGDLVSLAKYGASKLPEGVIKSGVNAGIDAVRLFARPFNAAGGGGRGFGNTVQNTHEILAASPGAGRTLYEPQTTAGEYARTAGQFAPGALVPGSMPVRAAAVVLPATLSESGGQLAREYAPSLEIPARIAGGVIGGGLVPRGAALAESALGRVKPAVQSAKAGAARAATGQPRPATAAKPTGDIKVARAVENAIVRDQSTPAAVRANLRPGAPAYLAGGENLSTLAELSAQSPGPGRSIMIEAVRKHQGAVPGEIKADIGKALKGEGDFFETIDNAKQARKDLAEPLKDAAFAQQINPERFEAHVEPVLNRVPKSALKYAAEIARREGRNPEELGLIAMAADEPARVGTPATASKGFSEALDVLKARKEVKTDQGQSLLHFLSKRGGIRDYDGDLKGMDAQLWHRNQPFIKKLVSEKGASADDATMAAWEAGYLPQFKERPPVNALYEAVSQELSGKPVFARPMSAERADLRGNTAGLEQRLGEAGISPRDPDAFAKLNAWEEEGASLERLASEGTASRAPNIEIVQTTRPTMETLHFIKKGMDQELEQFRNVVTGKLDLEGNPMAAATALARADLVKGMRKTSKEYDGFMQTWGDESGHIEALNLGHEVFKPGTKSELLKRRYKGWNDVERDSFRKGVGEAIIENVRSSKGGVGTMRHLLRDEELASRVRLAFPDNDSFSAFIESAARRVREQDRNSRIIGGSPTSYRDAARADLEAQSMGAADMAETLLDVGTGNVLGLSKRALKAVPKKDRSILGDPNMNATLARALADPAEMERLMQLLEDLKAKKAAQPALMVPNRHMATGGILGGLSGQ